MQFDFSEMNGEQLEARKAELIAEMSTPETRDALTAEDLEARKAEIEAIDGEIEAREARAAEEARKAEEAAKKNGKKPIEEGKRMNNYTIESPEYRTGLMKSLLGQELSAEERAAVDYVATTGDNTYGAANLLPKELLDRIWDMIDDQHSILGDIEMYRTGTVLEIAKRTEIVQGDAATVDENAANDDEINRFVKVTLVGKDFSKHFNISYAMAKMSVESFESFLVAEISDRIGAALANDVVAQVESGMDSGNAVNVTGAVKFADVAEAMSLLKNAKGNCNVYGTHATIYKYLVGMVDETGRPIFQLNAQNGAEGTLIGCPVKVEDGVADGTLLIGYPKQIVGNMVQDIMVESDKDIKNHVITYAGYARFQCELMAAKAFVKLTVTAGE